MPRQWLFQGKGNLHSLTVSKMGMQDPEKSVWQAFDFDRVAPLIPVQSALSHLDRQEIASSMAHSVDQ